MRETIGPPEWVPFSLIPASKLVKIRMPRNPKMCFTGKTCVNSDELPMGGPRRACRQAGWDELFIRGTTDRPDLFLCRWP